MRAYRSVFLGEEKVQGSSKGKRFIDLGKIHVLERPFPFECLSGWIIMWWWRLFITWMNKFWDGLSREHCSNEFCRRRRFEGFILKVIWLAIARCAVRAGMYYNCCGYTGCSNSVSTTIVCMFSKRREVTPAIVLRGRSVIICRFQILGWLKRRDTLYVLDAWNI